MRRRVAITGVGIVSPIGSGVEQFWRNLAEGRSGISRLDLFDVAGFPVQIGGQVRDDVPGIKGSRDRKVELGLAAARDAISQAGLLAGDLVAAQAHIGVSLESFCLSDLTAVAEEADLFGALLSRRGSEPLQTPLDTIGRGLAAELGVGGGIVTNCSACAAGAQAIGEAFLNVREGIADVAIAGGADSMLSPLGLGGFSLLRILSTENDAPESACRPFDRTRQGTVLGEGAAFLVLEEYERARARGATILAEVLGYGSSMDAFRLSDPEPTGRGAVLAMEMAIRDASLRPGEIDCVNAHATGTPKNDAVETAAIREVLGERATRIPVHAVKSMTGHCIAASGAIEAVAAVLTLVNRLVPPTINLHHADPECDLDYCAGEARPLDGRTVLSNSFGFGGQNAAIVFGRNGDDR